MFTRVVCLPQFTPACLPKFTHVYSCLPMFTLVYLCLPYIMYVFHLFTRVYPSLCVFLYAFLYLLLSFQFLELELKC